MAEPRKTVQDESEARRNAAGDRDAAPQHGGPDRAHAALPHTSVNREVAPRVMHRHKGDVGRPETNEEIFQGSKTRELK